MTSIIQNIHIENFKSAKDVTLTNCKRINLLIGKPHVGKSNLLEALSLFCLPFLKYLKKKEFALFPYNRKNKPSLFKCISLGQKEYSRYTGMLH